MDGTELGVKSCLVDALGLNFPWKLFEIVDLTDFGWVQLQARITGLKRICWGGFLRTRLHIPVK